MIDFSVPILVVEDFGAVGLVVVEVLKRAGFQHVDHVHDGVTALNRMRTTHYGLVISDWNMKPVTGLDLLKQIRSERSFADVRFLLMTGSSSLDLVLGAETAGADGVIAKPFTAQGLRDKINQAFARTARDTSASDN
jgi:two-component system, chemotaxis family, chemotaxis protein CheY